MNEIYKIKDFSFGYPFQKKGISINGEFEINQADIVLLTGNSGAGKSTLLYALKGLIPDVIYGTLKGKILFNQKDIQTLSYQEKLKIGLLFQNPNSQMINKTVFDELAFGLENLRFSSDKIKEKIKNMSREFGIQNLLDRNLTTLSGGEKQKVALLSILLTEPQVILFDEPTAFLDPKSAKIFIDIFNKIIKNKTVVIVEHNLAYLKNTVNKIITIENNSIKVRADIEWEKKLPQIHKDYSDEKMLEVKDLSFAYKKGKEIIGNLNLTVYKNQIVGIIGENGAGKTTLLKLLARLIKPNKGEIILNSKKKYSLRKYYSMVSLLLQNPENHFLFSKVKKETSKKNLELLGIEHLEQQNPFTLSEGEKRRLSIAILLNNDANLILMDEPTFGQDFKNKVNLIKIIQKLHMQDYSFIIVSHDIPFLKSVCAKIYTLENGKLYETE